MRKLGWAGLIGVTVPMVAAAAPLQFTHSGRLLGADGGAVGASSASVGFELWTASSGGTQLWTESLSGVPVHDGYYSVVLGSGVPLDTAWFADGRAAYLQVLVNGTPMGARTALLSVPYALQAESAGGIAPASSGGTCDALAAGRMWHQEVGGNSVVRICAKNAGVYAWRDLYGPAPVLSNIDVVSGAPGQTVTVTGQNFVPGSLTATLGGNPLSISNVTSSSFTYVSPLSPTGVARALVVTNPSSGHSATYGAAWTNTASLPTGGTITTLVQGGSTYRLHAFTSVGSANLFVTAHPVTADVLVVGGGAGGGISHGDQDTGKGGGGAGGVLRGTNRTIAAGSHTVTIGAGGAGALQGNNNNGAPGNDGLATTAFGVTALGGGGGGQSDANALGRGRDGGSGGGGAARSTSFGGGASTQTTPSGWTAYGFGGGSAVGNGNYSGGGGGGAGGAGQNATDSTWNRSRGGNGGPGIDESATFGTTYGENGWFGGGGGGGTRSYDSVYGQSPGGLGGGGDGNCGSEGANVQCANLNAMANTGGGGGGSVESPTPGQYCSDRAGAGGSGIVLVRYKIDP